MNDPGTADPIAQANAEIDPYHQSQAQEERKKLKEAEQDYRDPRYAWRIRFHHNNIEADSF